MKRILVAVDLSPHAEIVLKVATELATKLDSEVCLLHMAAPDPEFVGLAAGPQSVRDSRAHELRVEHEALHEQAEAFRALGIETKPLLVQGATVDGIVGQASKLEADMIVMGSHGKGLIARGFLGSVSDGVLRQASCPVLVVPYPAT